MYKKHSRFPFIRYISVAFWPTWIGLAILRCIIMLPYKQAIWTGSLLGRIIYLVPSAAKETARRNIAACFPELDAARQRRLLKDSFLSLGISLIEISMCWWALEKKILCRTRITGLDRLTALHEQKQGAILLTAHFTTIEIGGSVINRYLPVAIMYREQKNKLFDAIMVRARERNCYQVIHRNAIKTMIKTLRAGELCWYAPDQHYSGRQFVFADFFGRPAATTTATARLAELTAAKVLPFYQVRLPDYQGYEIVIDKPLENFPSGDVQHDTETINRALEQMIRQAPAQYLWSHRRFKKTPDGITPLYP